VYLSLSLILPSSSFSRSLFSRFLKCIQNLPLAHLHPIQCHRAMHYAMPWIHPLLPLLHPIVTTRPGLLPIRKHQSVRIILFRRYFMHPLALMASCVCLHPSQWFPPEWIQDLLEERKFDTNFLPYPAHFPVLVTYSDLVGMIGWMKLCIGWIEKGFVGLCWGQSLTQHCVYSTPLFVYLFVLL
jgi:hypothetical protein